MAVAALLKTLDLHDLLAVPVRPTVNALKTQAGMDFRTVSR
jgi:hypothetical protein